VVYPVLEAADVTDIVVAEQPSRVILTDVLPIFACLEVVRHLFAGAFLEGGVCLSCSSLVHSSGLDWRRMRRSDHRVQYI
jgi:hypothetical protein